MADGPGSVASICSVLPPGGNSTVVLSLWELAIHKTGGYLYSRPPAGDGISRNVVDRVRVIGVPSPLALAIWMGVVSQFVPVIGTYIGGALPLLIASARTARRT